MGKKCNINTCMYSLGHTGQHCPSGITGLEHHGRAQFTVVQSTLAQVGQAQGSLGSGGSSNRQFSGRMQGLSGQITESFRARPSLTFAVYA